MIGAQRNAETRSGALSAHPPAAVPPRSPRRRSPRRRCPAAAAAYLVDVPHRFRPVRRRNVLCGSRAGGARRLRPAPPSPSRPRGRCRRTLARWWPERCGRRDGGRSGGGRRSGRRSGHRAGRGRGGGHRAADRRRRRRPRPSGPTAPRPRSDCWPPPRTTGRRAALRRRGRSGLRPWPPSGRKGGGRARVAGAARAAAVTAGPATRSTSCSPPTWPIWAPTVASGRKGGGRATRHQAPRR